MSSYGADTASHTAFMASYRSVTSKLKKRFMRKTPNVSAAAEQYYGLAKSLQQNGDYTHAAFCCVAAARCESALSNPTAAAETYAQAAQHYLQAEMDAQDLDFGGFEENLTEAVDCYEFAINIYKGIQRNSFAATLHSELAQALMAFGRLEEATMHFRNAAELLTESPLPATSALENAIECSIRRGSFESALTHILEIVSIVANAQAPREGRRHVREVGDHLFDLGCGCNSGVYRDLIAHCEITTVLLFLLMPAGTTEGHTLMPTLKRYRHADRMKRAPYTSEDIYLNICSLVLAFDARDVDALSAAQSDLWPDLSPIQNEVVNLLSHEICR